MTRDERARKKGQGRYGAANPVKAFIQNVHHFRDEALRDPGPPSDHVVIFDEAQRAWNVHKTSMFMRQRKNQPNFNHSEPEFLISYMDRHRDWALVVCLVGGGQEIHTGEAGIGTWVDALNRMFPHWDVHISPHLVDSEYLAPEVERLQEGKNVKFDACLHLSVSMRSFRAENVASFVKSLLDCDAGRASEEIAALSRFPVVITRDLTLAKDWIRRQARGSERYGLMASSRAFRLKPHAIDVRVQIDPVHWFLNGPEDIRSSFYLEDCATEFQVQGLEVDWACVTWDGDLRFTGCNWSFHDFRGNKWMNIRKSDHQKYLRNAYRVLLTRARQGMVICVPPGDLDDPTRLPEFYDPTFDYLASVGIPVIS